MSARCPSDQKTDPSRLKDAGSSLGMRAGGKKRGRLGEGEMRIVELLVVFFYLAMGDIIFDIEDNWEARN